MAIQLDKIIISISPLFFSEFKINNHYIEPFVAITVNSCVLKDLNPHVASRFDDKSLNYSPGTLISDDAFFEFGYDADFIFMDIDADLEIVAGRSHSVIKSNLKVFPTFV